MSLPPEHLRPNKAVAYKDGTSKHVPLSDEEWREYLDRQDAHAAKMAERNKSQYKLDREEAYKKEIYPFLDEAKAMQELDGDSSLMDELKAKRAAIKARHPEPV